MACLVEGLLYKQGALAFGSRAPLWKHAHKCMAIPALQSLLLTRLAQPTSSRSVRGPGKEKKEALQDWNGTSRLTSHCCPVTSLVSNAVFLLVSLSPLQTDPQADGLPSGPAFDTSVLKQALWLPVVKEAYAGLPTDSPLVLTSGRLLSTLQPL